MTPKANDIQKLAASSERLSLFATGLEQRKTLELLALPALHPDNYAAFADDIRTALSHLTSARDEIARLREAVEALLFAAETTDACLRTWNDNMGGPADVEGICTRARAALNPEKTNEG